MPANQAMCNNGVVLVQRLVVVKWRTMLAVFVRVVPQIVVRQWDMGEMVMVVMLVFIHKILEDLRHFHNASLLGVQGAHQCHHLLLNQYDSCAFEQLIDLIVLYDLGCQSLRSQNQARYDLKKYKKEKTSAKTEKKREIS